MRALPILPLSFVLLALPACNESQWFHVTEGHKEARIDSVWAECYDDDASLAVRVQVDGYGPDAAYKQGGKLGATGLTLIERSEGVWEVSFRVGIDAEAQPDTRSYEYVLRSDIDMAGPAGTAVHVRWAVLTGEYVFGGDGAFEYRQKSITVPDC